MWEDSSSAHRERTAAGKASKVRPHLHTAGTFLHLLAPPPPHVHHAHRAAQYLAATATVSCTPMDRKRPCA